MASLLFQRMAINYNIGPEFRVLGNFLDKGSWFVMWERAWLEATSHGVDGGKPRAGENQSFFVSQD